MRRHGARPHGDRGPLPGTEGDACWPPGHGSELAVEEPVVLEPVAVPVGCDLGRDLLRGGLGNSQG